MNHEYRPVKFYAGSGDCSARAYMNMNTIAIKNSPSCYGSITHEYIHLILGKYTEFWFQEGFPTFLSRKIKTENPTLRKYIDGNDLWFDDAKRIYSSAKISDPMIFVDDLVEKYSREKIKQFIVIEDQTRNFRNDTQTRDYYRLSASFCKHLADKIGLEKLIHLSKEKSHYSRSIVRTLENEGFNILHLYNSWLGELYPS